MISHIGGMSPGTDEGAVTIRSPSPMIASASGTSMAAFAGRSFWATATTAIAHIRRIATTQDAAARPSVTVSGAAVEPVQALVTAAEREVCVASVGSLEKFTSEFTFDLHTLLMIYDATGSIAYDATGSASASAGSWRSNALAAPLRQPSAMVCDRGSGKVSSSPSSTPLPRLAAVTRTALSATVITSS